MSQHSNDVYCREHDLYECWLHSDDPVITLGEVATEDSVNEFGMTESDVAAARAQTGQVIVSCANGATLVGEEHSGNLLQSVTMLLNDPSSPISGFTVILD